MSKFIYLIQLWGGTSEYLLTFLQKLQNRAARMVTKLSWYTPVEVLLTQCGWLSIRQLVAYHSLVQIYKTKQSKRPLNLYTKVSNQFPHNTRASDGNGIKQDKIPTSKLGQLHFSSRAVQLWNKLPVSIRLAPSYSVFKSDLKKWVKSKVPIN